MDFSQLDTQKAAEITYRFEVLHPISSEGTGAFIDVYHAESNAVKKFAAKMLRSLQKQEFENSRTRNPKFKELPELEQEKIENCVARIAGWEGVQWEGKELEFSEENARKLLTACSWMCGQIVEHSDNLGNFLKA